MKPRIMYIEYKGGALTGAARIGRVSFSQTGRTLYYHGKTFQTLDGDGYKANYYDIESREYYWISGCKKSGQDTLYPDTVFIDEDVREEYWATIRNQPENVAVGSYRSDGKYSKRKPR